MRTLPLALIAACTFCFALSALAQDKGKAPPDPKEQFAKKYTQYRTKCADEIFALGNFLFGKKQFGTAKTEFEQAIVWDPNHEKSRQKLGMKKQGADWVRDNAVKVSTTDDGNADKDGSVIDKYKTDRQKTEKKLADEAYRLGKWCADQKLAEESVKMYREAIDWNTNQEDARKALGHKKVGVKWITPEEEKEKVDREAKQKAAEDGQPYDTEEPEEKVFGMKFAKRKSAHFTVLAYFSQESTAKMVKAGETLFKEFHEIFELDVNQPVVQNVRILFLKDKKMFDGYCDAMSGMQGEELESYKRNFGRHTKMEVPLNVSHHEGAEADFPQDFVIHDSFHVLWMYRWPGTSGNMKGWLYECPAYWFTAKLNGSADCVCVGGESFAAGSGRGLGSDPHYWSQTVKDLVLQNKDPDMRTALICSMNSLTGEMLAKGWSVWDFMIKVHKPKLMKFIDLLNQGKEQDEALKEAFGWGYEELDHEWDPWVRANY